MTTDEPLGFWAIAEHDPHRPALVDPAGTTYSYRELDERANRVANGLRAMGLRPGDGVAIVLPNAFPFVELYLAAMQSGLYLTCIHFHLTGPEIAYIANDCEADVLVVDERYTDAAVAAAAELAIPADRRFSVGAVEGYRPYDEISAGHGAERPTERTAGTTMLYTSGTTGRPKGVRRPLPGIDPNDAGAASSMLSMLFDILPGPGAHLVAGPLYQRRRSPSAPRPSTWDRRWCWWTAGRPRGRCGSSRSTASPRATWCPPCSTACSASPRTSGPGTTPPRCARSSTRQPRARWRSSAR
jgi:hypothetical protein